MSLLDDVSIVVTPNGYKANTLFAAIPVPTFGSDVITDGGFPLPNVNWSLGGGWSVGSDVATHNGNTNSNISQSVPLTVGTAYSVTYTVVNASAGSRIGISTNATSIQIERTTDGTYTETFTASLSSFYIRSLWNNGNPVSLENVSVKEWVGADMDVTRATAATRVDENGLVNYAEVLGDIYASNFSSGVDGWTAFGLGDVAGGISIGGEDNSLRYTVSSAIGDTRAFEKISTLTIGLQYKVTFSYYIPSINPNLNAVFLQGSNIRNSVLDTWTTVTEYFTAAFVNAKIYVGDANNYLNPAATGETAYIKDVLIKEVTRDNVPRIDYTGGGCPHILAEPQRTNLVTYSEQFDNAAWVKQTDTTISSNATTSPDGYTNADKLVNSTSVNRQAIYQNSSLTGVVSFSVFAKKAEYDVIQLTDGRVPTAFANFDLTNGVLGSVNNYNATITSVGSGWYRCSISYDYGALTINQPRISLAQTTTEGRLVDFAGSGTDGAFIWGAQVEAGSYATSYIPTSGSAVTRNQDIFTRDGIGSLINSTEGVLFLEIAALSDDLTYRRISLSDSTEDNRISISYDDVSNTISGQVFVGGVEQSLLTYVLSDITEFSKIALKYKVNDFELWVDGYEIATGVSGSVFPQGTLNSLSFDNGSSVQNFFGKVKQLQVYDTTLTVSQLENLTV